MIETYIPTDTTPFVGLRPFESSESELFFGREEQINQLLSKLYQTNFVAVVGSSGSGKSSLVKAGLIPALKAGFLNSRDSWHIASMRPADRPIYYLAKALIHAFGMELMPEEFEKFIIEEGTDGIIEKISPCLSKGASLLILADQFEELFTHFKSKTDQRSLMQRFEFVNILLEILRKKLPIYVIITMRSDYIGNCNLFYELPELLSKSQFLVPRLRNEQLIAVIESPIKLFETSIQSGLTEAILNDLPEGDDQLPVLEHALTRLWQFKKEVDFIKQSDYSSIGRLQNALSNHANSIYDALVNEKKELEPIIPQVFKYLIDFDKTKKEGVRQPRKVKEIMEVTGAQFGEVEMIYRAFQTQGASFLFSPSGKDLDENSTIDISHESLMRKWDKFKQWHDEEEADKNSLAKLLEFAQSYAQGKGEILRGPSLANYVGWHRYKEFQISKNQPRTLAWARRYNETDFIIIADFIDVSRRKKRLRVALYVSIVSIIVGATLYISFNEILHETEQANLRNEILRKEAAILRSDSVSKTEQLAFTERLNKAFSSESKTKEELFRLGSEHTRLRNQFREVNNQVNMQNRVISLLRDSTQTTSARVASLVQVNEQLFREKANQQANFVRRSAESDSVIADLRRSGEEKSNLNRQLTDRLTRLSATNDILQYISQSFMAIGENDSRNENVIRILEGGEEDVQRSFVEFKKAYVASGDGLWDNDIFILRGNDRQKYLVIDAFSGSPSFDSLSREISRLRNLKSKSPLPYINGKSVAPMLYKMAREKSSRGKIEVDNTSINVDERTWTWTVFLTGESDTMDDIKCVRYTLDETFDNRYPEICEKGVSSVAYFPLTAKGYDTFTIRVDVSFKDGSKATLYHNLKLKKGS